MATAVGGVPEAITDGVSGRLVAARDAGALAEAVLELLDDRETAERFGTAARQKARESFSRARMLDGTERVYERVLAGNRSSGS